MNSLRDQLIKAGVATEEQAKKARAADARHNRQANQQKKQGGPKPQRESEQLAQEALAQERARARTLNAQINAEKQKEANEKAARDLVVNSEVKRPQSEQDIAFNFTQDGKVKHVYVNPDIHKQLSSGKLAICRTRGRYRVVPRNVAEKVRPIAPYLVVCLFDDKPEDPDYADFPIPDDLMW